VTYKGKRIKLGFAINIANPALNLYPALAMQSGFSKIGKLQLVDIQQGRAIFLSQLD
jgi:hypothetical protein